VAVDVEPLLVMSFGLDLPLHGYAHTFLGAGAVGLALAVAAFPFRSLMGRGMAWARLAYAPTWSRMLLSGLLGAWLHVLVDAPLYYDVQPFFPAPGNPLHRCFSYGEVYGFSSVCVLLAGLLYLLVRGRGQPPG
jgi:membrane-bound metal-dependent hydrolase YbcI (DUF457 family)